MFMHDESSALATYYCVQWKIGKEGIRQEQTRVLVQTPITPKPRLRWNPRCVSLNWFPRRCYLAPCDGTDKYGYSESDFTSYSFALIDNDTLTRWVRSIQRFNIEIQDTKKYFPSQGIATHVPSSMVAPTHATSPPTISGTFTTAPNGCFPDRITWTG